MSMSTTSLARLALVAISALGCSVLFEPDALKPRSQGNPGGQGTGRDSSGQGGSASRGASSEFTSGISSNGSSIAVSSGGAATAMLSNQQTDPLNTGTGGDATRLVTAANSTQGLGGTVGDRSQTTTQTSNSGGTYASLPTSTNVGASTAGQATSVTPNTNGGTTATTRVVPNGGTANGGTGAGTNGTTAPGGSSATTAASTANSTEPQQGKTVPRLTNGLSAKTTRYWDCCKPSCGWAANALAGGMSSPATACAQDGVTAVESSITNKCWENGSAYQCYWGAPWQVGPNLSYGFAAFNGPNCGRCYQLDFNGGKTMIVQAINIGDMAPNQFDLLIPGGGVGAAGEGACKAQWNDANLGLQSGGFRATCDNDADCIKNMCQAAFGSSKQMMDSCTWYTEWFNSGDNPTVLYAEVPCPADIMSRSGLQ